MESHQWTWRIWGMLALVPDTFWDRNYVSENTISQPPWRQCPFQLAFVLLFPTIPDQTSSPWTCPMWLCQSPPRLENMACHWNLPLLFYHLYLAQKTPVLVLPLLALRGWEVLEILWCLSSLVSHSLMDLPTDEPWHYQAAFTCVPSLHLVH